MFDDAAVDADPGLGTKKRLRTKHDFFVLSDEPDKDLDLVLAADSVNTFVMEYKLAWLLLHKDMEAIVTLLPKLEKMGYKRIPKNIEEAVVTYKLLKIGEIPKLNRLKINPQTEQRFRQYYQVYQQNSGNRQQAQRALARNFSGTYWYYVLSAY